MARLGNDGLEIAFHQGRFEKGVGHIESSWTPRIWYIQIIFHLLWGVTVLRGSGRWSDGDRRASALILSTRIWRWLPTTAPHRPPVERIGINEELDFHTTFDDMAQERHEPKGIKELRHLRHPTRGDKQLLFEF